MGPPKAGSGSLSGLLARGVSSRPWIVRPAVGELQRIVTSGSSRARTVRVLTKRGWEGLRCESEECKRPDLAGE